MFQAWKEPGKMFHAKFAQQQLTRNTTASTCCQIRCEDVLYLHALPVAAQLSGRLVHIADLLLIGGKHNSGMSLGRHVLSIASYE